MTKSLFTVATIEKTIINASMRGLGRENIRFTKLAEH